jgi:hypothetical protein
MVDVELGRGDLHIGRLVDGLAKKNVSNITGSGFGEALSVRSG